MNGKLPSVTFLTVKYTIAIKTKIATKCFYEFVSFKVPHYINTNAF